MLDGLLESIAWIYGFKTIGGLIRENAGLIVILAAFIGVCVVFYRLFDRQFPSGAREPFKKWIFKITIVFFICAFVFVSGFTVFHEKKKAGDQSMISPAVYKIYS